MAKMGCGKCGSHKSYIQNDADDGENDATHYAISPAGAIGDCVCGDCMARMRGGEQYCEWDSDMENYIYITFADWKFVLMAMDNIEIWRGHTPAEYFIGAY